MLMFGLMMVLMMMWRPEGLMPMKRPHLTLRERQADQEDTAVDDETKAQPAAESV